MSASLRERRGSGSTGLEADADVVLDRARAAIEEEHSMTLWSAVTAAWQTGLTNGTCIGEMIGLALTGIFADKYGQRWTIIGALGLVILCGIPWGVFQTITPSYAAEVVPTELRPYLTCYVNLCWVSSKEVKV
ncbi:unnamed protein product, partial [Aureobasidium pullulans]